MWYAVALLSPPYSTLTYAFNDDFPADFWCPGLRVTVPLGKGAWRAGVILASVAGSDVPEGVTIRPLGWPLEIEPLLDAAAVELIRELAVRQGYSPGALWGHILPRGLRSTQVRFRQCAVNGLPRMLTIQAVAQLSHEERRTLSAALLTGSVAIVPPRMDTAREEYCILAIDPPWPVRPAAVRQAAVLDFLLEHGAVSRRELLTAVAGARSALSALVKAEYVRIDNKETDAGEEAEDLLPPPSRPFLLSPAQIAVVEDCRAALTSGRAATRLLFGVTGSGKTAVYLELMRLCLTQGRSVMVLAPEVALALKLRRDIAVAMPDAPVVLYHGYQSPQEREITFRMLGARSAPCIVVGTRSALFLPTPNLGAVILDEEHDASFKQDEGVPYQAKEVAWFRIRQCAGLLLLGSATPDVKTYYAAQQGRLPLLRLPERVGGGGLPAVDLININIHGGEYLLAPAGETALMETLRHGDQAVVLLNRRGYAPQMYCLGCQSVARCPHCEISLTYHKARERLVCHYCGYTVPFPAVCPQCKGMQYRPMGGGTEKLAERLSELAGRDNVLRLDKDSTRRPGRMEEILASFARREAQVLVGTQMLSKGHHFPHVTLALVADGDVGLNLPDYRAAERTFQLLVQSSGRAGRGTKAGRVLIQTRDEGHYCWKYVQKGDFEGFYAAEIALREARRYPPFVRLARLLLSLPVDCIEYEDIVRRVGVTLKREGQRMGVVVLGPVPAPLALLRGRRRYHSLFKATDWAAVRQVYFNLLRQISNKEIRFYLDLDPVNML